MRDPYLIIERPLLSEKAMDLGSVGKYTFRVSRESNKIEIALAVEAIFKLEPGSVDIGFELGADDSDFYFSGRRHLRGWYHWQN